MGEGHFLSKKRCRHGCCGDNEPSPHQRLCCDLCEEQPHAHTCSHVSVVCVRTHRMHPLQLLPHLQDDRPSLPSQLLPFGSTTERLLSNLVLHRPTPFSSCTDNLKPQTYLWLSRLCLSQRKPALPMLSCLHNDASFTFSGTFDPVLHACSLLKAIAMVPLAWNRNPHGLLHCPGISTHLGSGIFRSQ